MHGSGSPVIRPGPRTHAWADLREDKEINPGGTFFRVGNRSFWGSGRPRGPGKAFKNGVQEGVQEGVQKVVGSQYDLHMNIHFSLVLKGGPLFGGEKKGKIIKKP